MTPRGFISIAALYGGLAVAFGAFGAHALKDRLAAPALAAYETAVRYQFYHALALLVVGLWMLQPQAPSLRAVAFCFAAGTLLFSGSIYLLSLRTLLPFGELRFLGPVTPLGGLLLLVGWGLLAAAAWRGARP